MFVLLLLVMQLGGSFFLMHWRTNHQLTASSNNNKQQQTTTTTTKKRPRGRVDRKGASYAGMFAVCMSAKERVFSVVEGVGSSPWKVRGW